MKKLFPPMMERLNGGYIFCIFAYWVVAFVLIPFVIPLLSYGLWEDYVALAWFDTVYYGLNGLALAVILKEHLTDAVMGLQIGLKSILLTALIALALMLGWMLVVPDVLIALDIDPFISLDMFPVAPMAVMETSGFMVMNNPLFGTLCMTLLVPFSVCGMFYATGFAPACCRKPWLGYLCVTIVLLLPALFEIAWRGRSEYLIPEYLIRMPVHLVACWSYQKTDNIWTPIFALSAFNLGASLFNNALITAVAG